MKFPVSATVRAPIEREVQIAGRGAILANFKRHTEGLTGNVP